ncbi:hypothetical protein ACNKFW_15365 (plasmid) [Paracoccus sp. TD-10]|uniref:hypothetical protein n=1 Tax=Paracoccus sp. TD-10 TaxID=3395918 RepID=UPI003AAE8F41
MTDTRELVELDNYLRDPSVGLPWEVRIKIADLITAQAEENRRLREAILREAAAICKRIRLRPDLSEDERVGVLECALALTDEANAARAALSSTGEKG